MSRPSRAFAAAAACAVGAATLVAVPPAAVAADEPLGIRINEVVSNGGTPDDWIEFYNYSDDAVDLSEYIVQDESDKNPYTFPAGTVVAPGEYLVIDTLSDSGEGDFDFGLGKGDSVRLFAPGDANGAEPLLQTTWPVDTHAAPSWGAQGDGADVTYALTAEATKGGENVFPDDGGEEPPAPGSVVLNEVDSGPADWVELYNPGTEAFDISGYEIRDNSDDHRWQFPAGSTIAGGEFLVVDADTTGLVFNDQTGAFEDGIFAAAIGIGSADQIRLYDASGAKFDETHSWGEHANIDGDEIAATLARCPDGVGAFVLAYATPGAANDCVPPTVAINEIDSNGSPDWAEIVNTGTDPVDISGWTLMDDDPVGHAADVKPLAEGTILEPGEYFVFNGTDHFTFGLGNGDTVTIRNADGLTVAEHVYPAHADGFWARCEDGTGDFVEVAVSTPGIRNACGNPVRLNEVESDGDPDWIELANPTSDALDVSGIVVKDDDDTHSYEIPAGTSIPAGGYLVLDGLGFGIGKDDRIRVFDGDQLVDSTSWGDDHVATTWGRCPDVSGPFAATTEPTPGAANICPGEVAVSPWPGSPDVRVLDTAPTFLEDSSGLDVQETADGTFLWAVDNGTGRIWKLNASADGSVSMADGWDDGKRVRFQKDADNPGAAGPDTEGITVDGSGLIYVASERDNSAKGVNQNMILQVDPDEAGPDLVALTEWDLTEMLPAVGANLGIEAVEWVSDTTLAGSLFDDNTNAPYDGAAYAGDGLFFVAVEDGGGVYAFALAADGSAQLVSTIDPGLAGVMSLDYDSVLGVLWAVCDDGCGGTSAQITLNGTDQPGIEHFARPAGMPDINNEGFATAPASLSTGEERPVWWFADGYTSEALRVGTLPGATDGGSGDGGSGDGDGDGSGGGGSDDSGAGSGDDGGDLATTGSEVPGAALLLALTLLIGGAVVASRRRKQSV